MGAPPCPDTPMYTSQRTLLQDTLTMIFLFLQLHFIQLSPFSTYYNCFFYNWIKVMSKYAFKLYAVDWVYSGRAFSCFSQYTSSRIILNYMTHMTPWNFLPSKFFEEHTMNKIVEPDQHICRQILLANISLSQIYQHMYCLIWKPFWKVQIQEWKKSVQQDAFQRGIKQLVSGNSYLTNG